MMLTAWLVCLAASVQAQGPLGAELERAASRYKPPASPAPDEVEELTAAAREDFRAGRREQAIAALDKAAALAFKSGATGRSFQLSLAAAEAQRAAGRLEDAALRFRGAALSNANDPRAASAHQTACQAFAAILDPPSEEKLETYDQMLAEHTRTWPEADTSEAIGWQRTELLVRRRRWSELLERVRRVTPRSKRYERSRQLLVAAHDGLLEQQATPERFAAARADLEPLFISGGTAWTAGWTPTQREAAYTLARSATTQGVEGRRYTLQLLGKAYRDRPAPRPGWQRRAAVLLVAASLALSELDNVNEWLADAYEGPDVERQRLLVATRDRLAQDPGADAVRREADRLGQSVLALSGAASQATPQRATALAEAGRDEEAIRLYKRLAGERPNDRGVQVAYAKLLAASRQATDQEQAEVIWRKVEARSERSSPEWFEARLARLRLLIGLGQREEARKLLAMTRLLSQQSVPESGDPFAEIEQALK